LYLPSNSKHLPYITKPDWGGVVADEDEQFCTFGKVRIFNNSSGVMNKSLSGRVGQNLIEIDDVRLC
jgi:hypothetical protein